ncbi:MAG: aldo/keto reductase [Proteobacteria bacterium]|nr:aldo/keto reductase [Pseudomonadota bacterium]
MEYRPFGQTGLEVSAIGLGCWEIGGGYGAIEQAEFERAVGRALDLGINCFDTAEAYGFGASERALAQALGSRRGEALVVTKVGVGYPDKPNYRDSSRERIMASIESSLQSLGTDYVDLYLIHWPDVNVPFEETMRALEDIVQQGKTRFVGVSNFRREQMQECMPLRRIDVSQNGLHLFDRRMEREVFPYCRQENIGVMAYGSLAYGLLTGTLVETSEFDEDDWRSRRGNMGNINLARTLFGPEYFRRNIEATRQLTEIARRHGKNLPQLALRWTSSHPAVSVALVGCRNVAEVEDNVGAVDWTLSEEDRSEIDAVFERLGIDPAPDTWVED